MGNGPKGVADLIGDGSREAGPSPGDSDAYQETLLESFRWRYEQHRDVWSWEQALSEAADRIFHFVPDRPSAILDIGTGTAERLLPLAASGHRIVGIDLMELPGWDRIRRTPSGSIELVRGSFLEWSVADEHFDFVSDLGCLHHQHPSSYLAYLRKVRAILKPGGRFGLCTYLEKDPSLKVGSMETTNHGRLGKNFTEAELLQLLDQAGLTPVARDFIARPALDRTYLLAISERRP